jgi:alpha-ketoglutarate-dependent taurine dioxygenase
MNILKDVSDNPEQLGSFIAEELAGGAGFVHVTGLEFHHMSEAERITYIRVASLAIGELGLVDYKPGTDLWLLDKNTSPNRGQVPHHTDNPYHQTPEHYVGFWSIQGSGHGGENVLLPATTLKEHIYAQTDGKTLLEDLETQQLVFSRSLRSGKGPIIDTENNLLRFDRKHVSGDVGSLIQRFCAILDSPEMPSSQVSLGSGEVLFFDNHALIHSRNAHDDPERVIVRVQVAGASQE